MTSTTLKRSLALALAGGSLAIGVPAALAGSGGGESGGAATPAPASSFIQEEGEQQRPDREDCPERDGSGGGSSDASSALSV
jgi:hypothetical protein